jgi:hypothetical protein
LKWSIHLDNAPLALNALTAPVVARHVATPAGAKTIAYVAGSSNRLFAVDAATGSLVWQRTFQSYVTAKVEAFFLCPNAINATPVIDRRQNLIFALAFDGRLFGLDLGTGSIKFGPFQLVPPFAKAWSLNLSNGSIYTTTSQGCGGDRSGIYSMRVDDPVHRVVYETLARNGSGAGMWARGGTSIGENVVVYVSTGDAGFDPAHGDFGSTFLSASAPELNITDYFTPQNWREINQKGVDISSGGHLWFGDRTTIVGVEGQTGGLSVECRSPATRTIKPLCMSLHRWGTRRRPSNRKGSGARRRCGRMAMASRGFTFRFGERRRRGSRRPPRPTAPRRTVSWQHFAWRRDTAKNRV